MRPFGARVNEHPIRCWRCYEWIEVGAGFVFRERPTAEWRGEHDECPETDGYNRDPDDYFDDDHDGG